MEQNDFKTFKTDLKIEIQEGGPIFPFGVSANFLDWFIEKGEFFEYTHTVIPNNIKVTSSAPGNCFHNSQLVCLQNDEVPYFEGIMRGVKKKSIIHHGFNMLDKKVLDVTCINNNEGFIDELKDEAFYYFGVCIENKFIYNFPDVFRLKYYNNYVILKYHEDTLAL